MSQTVYYFPEGPTIAYCRKCDRVITDWYATHGLVCSICLSGADDLSLFVWDRESKYPEED